MLTHIEIITFVFLTICSSQLIEANVLFHFGFNFMVKDAGTDSREIDENFNKTIEVINNQINVIDSNTGEQEIPESLNITTSRPIDSIDQLRKEQIEFNEAIITKIFLTKEAFKKLNYDLYPLVGRSNFIAGKVKFTTRYLNAVEEVGEKPKLEILEQFVSLVDELKAPPTDEEGGERTLEYVLMKLMLEKHGILELQQHLRHMNAEVRNARETWQRYINSKLIEVSAK